MDRQKSNNNFGKRGAFDARLVLVCACFAFGALSCFLVFSTINANVNFIAGELGAGSRSLAFFSCAVLLAFEAAAAVMAYAPVAVAVLSIFSGAAMCFMSHLYAQTIPFSTEFLKFAVFCFVCVSAFVYVPYNALAISARLKILLRNDRCVRNSALFFSAAVVLSGAAVAAAGFFCL